MDFTVVGMPMRGHNVSIVCVAVVGQAKHELPCNQDHPPVTESLYRWRSRANFRPPMYKYQCQSVRDAVEDSIGDFVGDDQYQ